jgi:7,8-dihydropterin-6-yl-methyl-4-(beta-D-ribofuranosyl)aminobenzene 5'-phosphate synthase
MKITVLYDNDTLAEQTIGDWGFSCLIEGEGIPRVMFDTGANGSVLLYNMNVLGIPPSGIGAIVISHAHFDHTGGLKEVLQFNSDAELFLPLPPNRDFPAKHVTTVRHACPICEHVSSTGVLNNIEQSLLIETNKGTVIITGCAHPGVGKVLDIASGMAPVRGIMGGLHGFDDFERLSNLEFVCPCHCTQYKMEIEMLFPEKYIKGGVGAVVII